MAKEFLNLGYRPHPISQNDKTRTQLQKKESRLLLIRLGIAAACSGNIMLLAISLYGGATGGLATGFKWLSLVLSLPVFGFSAVPFYKSAWSALKNKQPSIDIPVVTGLLIGFFVSIVNLLTGSDQIYFDSLSSLVFLLLCTRYLLKKTQQNALSSSHLLQFLMPYYARRFNFVRQNYENVQLDQIQAGDLVQVKAGECIPVDGVIQKGESSVSQAFLTGESKPEKVKEGDSVLAGALNYSAPLEIQTTYSGVFTRLGKLLKLTEQSIQNKARIITFSDQVSQGFILAVLLLSAGTFIYELSYSWHEGLSRALALSLVTCPCAFALATPLALSITLGRLAKTGILVKSSEAIERLCQINSVFFDKTGTLTYGELKVLEWESFESLDEKIKTQLAVYQLELNSNHPIAYALKKYLESSLSYDCVGNLQVQKFSETLGKGVSGFILSSYYEVIRNLEENTDFQIAVYRDGQRVAWVRLGDPIRSETKEQIQKLRKMGLKPWILSGDHRSIVTSVGEEIGIQSSHCIFEASPEVKSKIVQSYPKSLMVGDGANDAVALASAFLGIATHSGVEISMKAADIYMSKPGIQTLVSLITIAKETMKVVYRNFGFSIFYNLIVGWSAITGRISPLFAAILMPLSALTVFLSSILGTRKMKKIFQELMQ